MARKNYLKNDRSVARTRRKKVFIAAGLLLGVYLLASFILGEMGMVKYYRMKVQHESLQEEIRHLKQDNVRLLREVRALRSEPAVIERIARDKLGLARPGEIVYYYDVANSKSEAPNLE
jgi:cell division protein FtsB